MIHRSAGEGERSTKLTDFEFRVWVQYILSADDYGVMLRSPLPLQNGSRALRRKTVKVSDLVSALERLVTLGLVSTFEHHGEQYVWQPDWQDRQNIRYPRPSVLPAPPPSALGAASAKTQKLFSKRSGVCSENFQSEHGERAVGGQDLTTTNTYTNTHTGIDLPEGVQGEGSGSTSDVPPAWSQSGRRGAHGGHDTLINGRDQRRHGEHVGPGCELGLCLLPAIASDHRARLSKSNDTGPDGRSREQFYRDVIADEQRRLDAGGQPCGDTPWQFWNKRFAEWLGLSPDASQQTTKGARTAAAGRRLSDALAAGARPDPFGTQESIHTDVVAPALVGTGGRS
jgi:hypothetical protein